MRVIESLFREHHVQVLHQLIRGLQFALHQGAKVLRYVELTQLPTRGPRDIRVLILDQGVHERKKSLLGAFVIQLDQEDGGAPLHLDHFETQFFIQVLFGQQLIGCLDDRFLHGRKPAPGFSCILLQPNFVQPAEVGE